MEIKEKTPIPEEIAYLATLFPKSWADTVRGQLKDVQRYFAQANGEMARHAVAYLTGILRTPTNWELLLGWLGFEKTDQGVLQKTDRTTSDQEIDEFCAAIGQNGLNC